MRYKVPFLVALVGLALVACDERPPTEPEVDIMTPDLAEHAPKGQEVCMVDNFGFHWDLTKLQAKGPMAYLEGYVDVDAPWLWGALGEISPPAIFGEEAETALMLTATNPEADACAGSYTDSFNYYGDRIIPGVSFSGTWESFCGGSPFGSGSWNGTFHHGTCEDLVLPSVVLDPFGATFDIGHSENPNAATVFNKPSGSFCFFSAEGGGYSGGATIVATANGNVNITCAASLESGTPVDRGTRVELDFLTPYGTLPCDVQLTPSGNGNVSCHARAAFSMAGGRAPLHQVSGGGTVEWPAGLVTYGLNAKLTAAGDVKGQLQYHGRDVDVSGHGTLTCMYVEDNTAFLGGVWTSSTNESWVGTEFRVGLQDNGEGVNATGPDLISSISIFTSAADCVRGFTIPFREWTNGNVQLK